MDIPSAVSLSRSMSITSSSANVAPATPVAADKGVQKESAVAPLALKGAGTEPVNVGLDDNAVAQINRLIKRQQQDLEFSLDKDTNRVVYKLIDSNTGEVIRQIPSEEFLSLARSLANKETATLLKDQA